MKTGEGLEKKKKKPGALARPLRVIKEAVGAAKASVQPAVT